MFATTNYEPHKMNNIDQYELRDRCVNSDIITSLLFGGNLRTTNSDRKIPRGGSRGAPLITKNEAPAPKFYKIEAPEWQF